MAVEQNETDHERAEERERHGHHEQHARIERARERFAERARAAGASVRGERR